MDDLVNFPSTPQEKFLIMLVERVGNLEETMFKTMDMINDIRKFLMTNVIRGCVYLPSGFDVDKTILDKIVAAVQENKFIMVERAWVIVRTISASDKNMSIYLQVKDPVIVGQVSESMNQYMLRALKFTSMFRVQPWLADNVCTLDEMEKGGGVCSEGIYYGKPVVFYADFR